MHQTCRLGAAGRTLACRIVVFALAFAGRASAQDEATRAPAVQVHGFVSQGFLKTANAYYLANDSKRGSFQFTEAGIDFTAPLSDNLTAGVQLFARDLGSLGNYRPQFDWYYLDYHFRDWLGFRAGRTKIPFGLYNETSDIDAARVPIFLPTSVYPVENRDYLLAQTGGEIYGNLRSDNAGEIEYRLYTGTIHIDTTDSRDTIQNLSVKYVVGGRLMWLAPVAGLQLGGSVQALRLDYAYAPDATTLKVLQDQGKVASDFTGPVDGRISALLWVGSLEYTAGDLSLASEYSRWYIDSDSSYHAIVPPTTETNERAYVMASYHVRPWFTPGAYYAVTFPDTRQRHGRAAYQHDIAVSVRYDIGPHWLVKLEGHYMLGTANLDSALNDNTPRDRLPKNWGLFAIKTTAYF